MGWSLPTKIFFAVATITVAFAVTMGVALVHHRRTLRDLTLVSGGLVPVTLTVAEVRNTQELLVTTLESDPERRAQWLALAHQLRPATLRRTARAVRRAGLLAEETPVTAALEELAGELDEVADEASAQDQDYAELFSALESGDSAQVQDVLYGLIRRERDFASRLDQVQSQVNARLTLITREVEGRERQLLWSLLFLTIGALLVAAAATLFAYRAVTPLSRLTAGVAAVGGGELTHHVHVVSSDEIGTLAREFNRMTARLVEREERLVHSERLAAIGRVASKVTHEIRNPLNVMRLNAEMLWEDLAELGPPERIAEPRSQVQAILERMERLEALTEEYLRFARLPHPVMELREIPEIIEDFFGFQRHELDARAVELQTHFEADLPFVAVDEGQLQQVLTNLVRNACEAMPDGGQLTVTARGRDQGVSLEVCDNGAGMEAENVDRIFDPFFTTKERGTGLGLPLARQIAVEHGGALTCQTERGQGTCFDLWLPPATSSGDRGNEA
jgi:signal transduction histidine kinase